MLAPLKTKFIWLLKETTGSCMEVTRLLSQGMDRPLPWYVRLRIRGHFLICYFCRRYGVQLRFLRRASRRYQEREDAGPRDHDSDHSHAHSDSHSDSPDHGAPAGPAESVPAFRPLTAEAKERIKARLRGATPPPPS